MGDLDGKLDSAKERVKELKATHKMKSNLMRKIARELSHPEEHPLYNGNGHAATADVEVLAWRDVPLEEALQGINLRVIAKIKEHGQGFKTVGDLADWFNANHAWTDIDGIGEATAEKLQDAWEAFWKRWNDRVKPKDNGDVQDAEFTVKGLLPGPPAKEKGRGKGKRKAKKDAPGADSAGTDGSASPDGATDQEGAGQ